MAVPSRVYVGVTVFGLLASVLVVPYTLLLLSGWRPPALSPFLSFEQADEGQFRVFLVAASLVSIGLASVAWRALIVGARRDARRREARKQVVREQRAYRGQRRPPPRT